jgi:hypothetical protein
MKVIFNYLQVYGLPRMHNEKSKDEVEVLKYDLNKKIIDDGLIKEIKNDEISSGTLELCLDKEDNDIEYKKIENSRKIRPAAHLFINEYTSMIEKNTKIETFDPKSFQKNLHLGSGDQPNFENFEEIEDIEIKNEKILKQAPFDLLENKNSSTKQVSIDVDKVNFINASENCTILDKNGDHETKAIKIICRKDDILTVLLDRKNQKEANTSHSKIPTFGNNWKLKKKFSIFSNKKASENFSEK